MILGLTQTFTLDKLREHLDCLVILFILLTLLPTLMVLSDTMNLMLRMNYFLIVH